jgi:hypothetical protein
LRDASPPPPQPAVDRPAAAPAVAGVFAGSLSGSARGGGTAPPAPVEVDLRQAGGQLVGRVVHPVCGSLPMSLAIDAAGVVSGGLRLPEAASCTANAASASGRLAGSSLTLDLRGVDVSYRGTLSSSAERRPASPTQPPGQRSDVP